MKTSNFPCCFNFPLQHAAAVMALLVSATPLHAQQPATLGTPPAESATKSIPFDQLGAEAQKQYAGDGIGITPKAGGARLRAAFQDLEAEATPEGLWLESTADEDAGKLARFRVRAAAIGREGGAAFHLADRGQVRTSDEAALLLRPGLIEEYTVSMDGVRQDFVLPQRPAGTGELRVELTVDGARAEAATDGAKLTLNGNGREIVYSRLHVADACGRELSAKLEVTDPNRIQLRADDSNAIYPIRIDPTFSDADWSALGLGMNGEVHALAVSGTDLYAGGSFTTAGGVGANCIAKWNGSTWSALGSGIDFGTVYALAVLDSDLYAGGEFDSVGGINARGIAKWNGSTWSDVDHGVGGNVLVMATSGTKIYVGGNFTTAGLNSGVFNIAEWNGYFWSSLGSGMNNKVRALAVSGTDLYAGGDFTTAGGGSANRIAKWNGNAWSALDSGMGNVVFALAVLDNDLYAGGMFTAAGGQTANYIAKWNGSAWSGMGSGTNGRIYTLVASATNLYSGGSFNTAGGKSAAKIAQAAMPINPEIDVEHPAGIPLADGSSSVGLGLAAVGYRAPAKTFTVRSTGTIALTLSGVTTSGGNAGDFTVDTTGMATTVTPGTTTTFAVTFHPTGPGERGTTLQIFSNDEDESSFDITLTGTSLSFTADGDGDGLNDASEFQLAALGFNWELPQLELVNTYYNSANGAGLFTPTQVQALHIDTPLIQRDALGAFTLTLGLQKSATLLPGSFQPFFFNEVGTQIQINDEGKIEFQFTSPDNAAFFRLEAR